MRLILPFLLALVFSISSPAHLSAADKKIRVGVSLPTTQQDRWVRDGEAFLALAAKKQMDVIVEMGNNNQMQQNLQVGRLLGQDIDILILAPHDAVGAVPMVRKAHDAGVRLISYDRLVLDANVDAYISFDLEKVGELQALYLTEKAPRGDYIILSGAPNDNNARYFRAGAMKIITPLVEKGLINILADAPVIDWIPENAGKIVEKLLADGLKPAAILAPNDGTAGGVIAALEAGGLAGKIPVSGQDADLEGARRIAAGLQSMTVFKDTRLLAEKALDLAGEMAEGEAWKARVNAQSQVGQAAVPTIFLEPLMVDKNNLEKLLIDSGYLKKEAVFGNERE